MPCVFKICVWLSIVPQCCPLEPLLGPAIFCLEPCTYILLVFPPIHVCLFPKAWLYMTGVTVGHIEEPSWSKIVLGSP